MKLLDKEHTERVTTGVVDTPKGKYGFGFEDLTTPRRATSARSATPAARRASVHTSTSSRRSAAGQSSCPVSRKARTPYQKLLGLLDQHSNNSEFLAASAC
jgi:hypothetical protein